eukprot:m.747859 g.747859  ORF g.747859 m.747859 type:complete len:55 (+) comp58967_c1_seq5:1172-1336(+)
MCLQVSYATLEPDWNSAKVNRPKADVKAVNGSEASLVNPNAITESASCTSHAHK